MPFRRGTSHHAARTAPIDGHDAHIIAFHAAANDASEGCPALSTMTQTAPTVAPIKAAMAMRIFMERSCTLRGLNSPVCFSQAYWVCWLKESPPVQS